MQGRSDKSNETGEKKKNLEKDRKFALSSMLQSGTTNLKCLFSSFDAHVTSMREYAGCALYILNQKRQMRQKTNEENSSTLDQGQIMIILADSEDSLTALSDKTLDKY